jgi:His-Xaa-Ser system radical SAM maturase HxsC
MIDLFLKAEFDTQAPPFVTKLCVARENSGIGGTGALAIPRPGEPGTYECHAAHGRFVLRLTPEEPVDGDVLLCVPSRGEVNRLFRRRSRQNTLLLTERCDQLCVMCSQPPKNTDDEWRFPLYEQALLLADQDTIVGISGGEPTLYKRELLAMIARVAQKRPDLRYHILSNAQHFTSDDEQVLRSLRTQILWGIPLYSHREDDHDEIVGKAGAFRKVMGNLLFLFAAGAPVELRTVITAKNVFDLGRLANFIADNIPFIADWAIMGMEPIGYARANWKQLFFDHSLFSQPLVNALEISALRGIPCRLYNVPRCTMPEGYRRYCADSISDWKKKYLPACEGCDEKDACSGFFEWYSPQVAWSGISPIIRHH